MRRATSLSLLCSLCLHAAVIGVVAVSWHGARPLPVAQDVTPTVNFLLAPETCPPPAPPLPIFEPPVPMPAPTPEVATVPPPAVPAEAPPAAPMPIITTTHGSLSNNAPQPPAKKGKPAPPIGAIATSHATTGNGGSPTGGSAGGAANTPARPRFHPAPAYPPEAKRNREQGVAVIRAQVTAEGVVAGASVLHSSGFPLLDQAALTTVRGWRFDPARIAGITAASNVEVPVRFRLTN